jgi:adenylate cyclase
MTLDPSLQSLSRCFQGLIPSAIATCAPDGTPNVTFLSQVYYVDATHVALSCQFFNKTRRNVEKNPFATVEVMDPATLQPYRLSVRYTHSETSGPLFEAMDLRIQAIASVTGMAGIFRLIAADVYEVLAVERVDLLAEAPAATPATPEFSLRQVLGVQIVSQQVNRGRDLDETLELLLSTLDDVCGFSHSMMLVPDESGRLVAIASRGYGEQGRKGIGAEVCIGEGFIGTAAEQRRVLRVSNVEGELRYGRAVRQRMETKGETLRPEIALPGLPGAQSHLAVPLVVQDRLVGVLALESRDPLAFGTWDESTTTARARKKIPPRRRSPNPPLPPRAVPSRSSRTTTASSSTASTSSATSPARSSGSCSAPTTATAAPSSATASCASIPHSASLP